MHNNKILFKQTEIGEIPNEWKVEPLINALEIISGGTPKTAVAEYWNGDIPWLSVVDFNNNGKKVYETEKYITELGLKNSSTNILKKGMLIISARGTVGVIAQLGKDMAFNQSCYGLDAKDNISSNDFLYYVLKSKIESIKQKTHGSVFSTITRDTFNDIHIPVPPIDEQQQIASVLSSLDDRIELNRKMNKTLEEMGKALFKRWFVDFEFPYDFAQGRSNENGEPYKSNGGEMVDSKLGKIPDGWSLTTIGEVCNTFGGGTPSTRNDDYWKDGNILWATPTDITALKSPIIFNTNRKITKEGLKNSSAKLLPTGTILLTSRATVGLLAISDMPIATNQGFIAIECTGTPSNYYMYFELLGRQHEIINKATGSTFREISRSTFRAMNLLLPTKELHDKYNSVAGSLFEQIRTNSLENEHLSGIRDSLLPRLMSGKIRVN